MPQFTTCCLGHKHQTFTAASLDEAKVGATARMEQLRGALIWLYEEVDGHKRLRWKVDRRGSGTHAAPPSYGMPREHDCTCCEGSL